MSRHRIVLSLVVATLVLTPFPAHGAVLVHAEDPRGDVKILTREGPTPYQLVGMDLRELKVVRGEDSTRFTLRIRRVTTSLRFDQHLRILLEDADPKPPAVSGEVLLTVQQPRRSQAIFAVEGTSEAFGGNCLISGTRVLRAKGVVKIDVPRDCLPPGLLTISVRSSSETPPGEVHQVYSRDVMRVPGSHDLGGTADDQPQ